LQLFIKNSKIMCSFHHTLLEFFTEFSVLIFTFFQGFFGHRGLNDITGKEVLNHQNDTHV